MKDLRANAQRLAKRGRAKRHDHELLQIDLVVGVGTAVDHVHLRDGQLHLAGAAEVSIER
jgi:hypothetical protein